MFDGKLTQLKTEDILLSEHQTRKNMDEYGLKKLSDSIKENGILQPLTVRPAGGGKYFLIAGSRRLFAARQTGLKRVPCIIRKADPVTADLLGLTENLRQESLTSFEEAAAIKRIMEEHNLPLPTVAQRLGAAHAGLLEKLRLLDLGEGLINRLTAARLTERHGLALLKIPPEKREEVLDFILANQLTLVEAEHYIESLGKPKRESEPPKSRCAIGDLRLFTNSLYKLTETLQRGGVSVSVERQENDGNVEYIVAIEK